jgi:Tol biopolymer transport system component
MNADGTGAMRLTNVPADYETPSWSPDDKQIAFSSDHAGNYEIYVMNADGSGVKDITNNPADDHSPAWQP